MTKLFAIIFICLLGISSQVLIKKGLNEIGRFEIQDIFSRILPIMTNVYIIAAGLLLLIGVLVYFSILSRNELSTLYPIAVGINFILLIASSRFLLGEEISLLKISGLLLILSGVSCFFYAKS